jgi:6-methylsalicylate decarboxylase
MSQRIDVQAHFLPERYRAALAAAGHSKPSGMPGQSRKIDR